MGSMGREHMKGDTATGTQLQGIQVRVRDVGVVVVVTISIGPSISLGVILSQKGELKQKRRNA